MKTVRVYNCNIPHRFAFYDLKMRAKMIQRDVAEVTATADAPVDTDSCVKALCDGDADIATFLWTEEIHGELFKKGEFEREFIFHDPLYLVLPNKRSYKEFVSAKGLKNGGSITADALRSLLTDAALANSQDVLMREKESGTRRQLGTLLRKGATDFKMPPVKEFSSTGDIFAMLYHHSRTHIKQNRIGFVSAKIRFLMGCRKQTRRSLIFLSVRDIEREFRVVYRSNDQMDRDPVSDVGELMVSLAREKDKQIAPVRLWATPVPLWFLGATAASVGLLTIVDWESWKVAWHTLVGVGALLAAC